MYSAESLSLLEQFGQLIQLHRIELESQSNFAKRLGVSRSTLQLIEVGSPKVRIGSYFEALTVLGLTNEFVELLETLLAAQVKTPARRVKRNKPALDNDF